MLLQKHPKTDLRLSNNIVHIRTCADSCRALADLIQYFASDGDLGEESDWKSDSTVKSRVIKDNFKKKRRDVRS